MGTFFSKPKPPTPEEVPRKDAQIEKADDAWVEVKVDEFFPGSRRHMQARMEDQIKQERERQKKFWGEGNRSVLEGTQHQSISSTSHNIGHIRQPSFRG